MKLVFLVGPHKTGSTYMQINLAKQRKTLLEAGWMYPKAGLQGDYAHHGLAHNFAPYLTQDGPEAEALVQAAAKARATGCNVVFAAEGFCRWRPRKFRAVAEVFGATEIEIVYMVRDPISVFYSYWAEEVKHGRTAPFGDKFLHALSNPDDDRLLNPMIDLAPLVRDADMRVRAVPFDTLVRQGTDMVTHVADTVLGTPDLAPAIRRQANSSLPVEVTELLRLAALHHGSDAPMIGPGLRLAFMRGTSAADRDALVALVQEHGETARRQIDMPADNLMLRRLEQVLLKRLAGLWTCPPDPEGLFPLRDRTLVYYDTYHLWRSDTIRAEAKALARRYGPDMPQDGKR